MGYTTKFTGTLRFPENMTIDCLQQVSGLMGCEAPDDTSGWRYMQFRINKSLTGIEWDGSEKFYGAVEAVNWLTQKIREQYHDFRLAGELLAQGEYQDDIWKLAVVDGVAKKIDYPPHLLAVAHIGQEVRRQYAVVNCTKLAHRLKAFSDLEWEEKLKLLRFCEAVEAGQQQDDLLPDYRVAEAAVRSLLLHFAPPV